jgi:hypothetical protein
MYQKLKDSEVTHPVKTGNNVKTVTLNFHILEKGNYSIITTQYKGSTYNILLDTGAGKSVFNKNYLDFFEKSYTGSDALITGATGEKVKAEYYWIEVPICDEAPFTISLVSDREVIFKHLKDEYNLDVCMVLGNSFLKETSAVIDYMAKTITFNIPI